MKVVALKTDILIPRQAAADCLVFQESELCVGAKVLLGPFH